MNTITKRKPTKAVKQAAEFCKRAQEIKAARIPDDCRLPDSIAEIERGRTPSRKQLTLIDDSTMGRLRAIKANEAAR